MPAMIIAAFKSVTPHLSSTINKAEGIRFGNRIGLEQFPPDLASSGIYRQA
jgi:hypothetical protein